MPTCSQIARIASRSAETIGRCTLEAMMSKPVRYGSNVIAFIPVANFIIAGGRLTSQLFFKITGGFEEIHPKAAVRKTKVFQGLAELIPLIGPCAYWLIRLGRWLCSNIKQDLSSSFHGVGFSTKNSEAILNIKCYDPAINFDEYAFENIEKTLLKLTPVLPVADELLETRRQELENGTFDAQNTLTFKIYLLSADENISEQLETQLSEFLSKLAKCKNADWVNSSNIEFYYCPASKYNGITDYTQYRPILTRTNVKSAKTHIHPQE